MPPIYLKNHPELRRVGWNYVGLCPFHQEKSPSFTVKPDTGEYHCLGCGKKGNMSEFFAPDRLDDRDYRRGFHQGVAAVLEVITSKVPKELQKRLNTFEDKVSQWRYQVDDTDMILPPTL